MEIRLVHIEESALEAIVKKAVAEALVQAGVGGCAHVQDKEEKPVELIGTAEACKILGVKERTMQRYRDRRCFTVIMRGPHKALYYRHEIEAFRDANRRSAR